jgi:uncharacterized protein (DUF1778 family)
MSTSSGKDSRLNFRLPSELKDVIEEAATAMGQSVSDYAIATLVKNSQAILQQSQSTILSAKERRAFTALLDETDAKPKRALSEAAKRYKKRFK